MFFFVWTLWFAFIVHLVLKKKKTSLRSVMINIRKDVRNFVWDDSDCMLEQSMNLILLTVIAVIALPVLYFIIPPVFTLWYIAAALFGDEEKKSK